MGEGYEPPSDFLKAIMRDEVPFIGSLGDANVARLIQMTRDPDRANRDWATLLLAQLERDTEEVRQALFAAAADEDAYVRGEAILGIAEREPSLALPLILTALQEETVCLQIFEAAAVVAHPSLIDSLRDFTDGEDHIDQLARDALAACEEGRAI
ncbi:HEAT repeat domain-containing protein [Sphingomonas psychrotolerans]|uniref:Lyase n=1 Tax=Sphingomonas psychrotolerans TaxID=1327635 RepID=A0A2K8MEG6_9SPHN|nr:HEAT repeat domain-containing protein [Sphingomonas psychrotolerans]ATY32290.1 lyase [Sphingomonas psychrotolerans]